MDRPDDAAIRIHVETFALVRRLLPIAVLVGSFAGPMAVAEPRVAMWYSAALFCASLFVLRLLAGLPLYPAHTFGIEYRFEDDPLEGSHASASDGRRCVHCEAVVDDGVHRRYARQFVLLGVPIYTFAWGENDICRDCLATAASARRTTDRTRQRSGRDRRNPEPGDPATAAASTGGAASAATDDAAPDAGSASAGDDGTAPSDDSALPRRRGGGLGSATAIARRIDPTDETAALEVRRAFEEGPP